MKKMVTTTDLRPDSCYLRQSRLVLALVLSLISLLAAYSQTRIVDPLHQVVSQSLPLRLPAPQSACAKMSTSSNRSIPWEERHEVTDILRLERPQYLENFKNPCWYDQTDAGMKLRCLPYFYLAGMPKAGTTDLWKGILKHPQVYIRQPKEPHWWTRGRYSKKRGIENYVKYFNRFANSIQSKATDGRKYNAQVTGDGSASTFWDNYNFRRIPQNCNSSMEPTIIHAHLIKHLIPQAKIIVILRNPIDRLYSGYRYFNARIPKSPEAFHNQSIEAISQWKQCVKQFSVRHCVYDRTSFNPHARVQVSMYSVYIKEWLKIFPREQLSFIQLEEYSNNRAKVLQGIFRFLELDPLETTGAVNNMPIQNEGKAKHAVDMFNKTKDLLERFYRPFNEEVSQLLNDQKFAYLPSDSDS